MIRGATIAGVVKRGRCAHSATANATGVHSGAGSADGLVLPPPTMGGGGSGPAAGSVPVQCGTIAISANWMLAVSVQD